MALTEIVALLRTKSKIIYPVTQLKNITDDSEDLTAPADADSVPLVDASDSGQMKKITWANIKTALSSLFAAKSHTHSDYLPLTGGTVDGPFVNVSGGSQKGCFAKFSSSTGGLASAIFSFHETEADAKATTNFRSVIGHLSSGTTPTYIYLAVLDPDSDNNTWDEANGLTIRQNALRWKGKDLATTDAATASAPGLMSAADKSKLDGIAAGANKYTHPAYTARSSGLYKITVDASGHVSAVTAVTKADITALGIPAQDTNTTYSAMKGASTSAAGASGLVPAPAAGAATRYLRSDGTWAVPPNTTYSLASFGITATAAELNKLDGVTATAAEINKLDGLTPTTAELNYVDGVTSNIQTQLNNKAAKTAATQSAAGLMSAADKKKLDGLSGDEVPVYIQESEPSENGCIWIKPK